MHETLILLMHYLLSSLILFVNVVFSGHVVVEGFKLLQSQFLHGMLYQPDELFTPIVV